MKLEVHKPHTGIPTTRPLPEGAAESERVRELADRYAATRQDLEAAGKARDRARSRANTARAADVSAKARALGAGWPAPKPEAGPILAAEREAQANYREAIEQAATAELELAAALDDERHEWLERAERQRGEAEDRAEELLAELEDLMVSAAAAKAIAGVLSNWAWNGQPGRLRSAPIPFENVDEEIRRVRGHLMPTIRTYAELRPAPKRRREARQARRKLEAREAA